MKRRFANIAAQIRELADPQWQTCCVFCRGEAEPAPMYQPNMRTRTARVEFEGVDVTGECLGATPGLGRYGFVWVFRGDIRGNRQICSRCGVQAASLKMVGDTRVVLK